VCQVIVEGPATAQAKEETTHTWSARDVGAPVTLGSFACTDRKRMNGGTPVGYSGRAALRREQCDITEEKVSTRLRHSKQPISITTIAHATVKELWEAVFSMDPRR
jgi:hypothetical protein